MAINPGLRVERKRGNIKPADHSNQPLQRGFGSLYSLWVGGGPDQSLLHLQPAACRFNSLHICEVPRVNRQLLRRDNKQMAGDSDFTLVNTHKILCCFLNVIWKVVERVSQDYRTRLLPNTHISAHLSLYSALFIAGRLEQRSKQLNLLRCKVV